ncbi:hypothetical protein H6786_04270 [Candidatus Nomurabacteria bacterium]|nr:hypothetical protein [Candidatus Nomurabacteria bacterium]
MATIVSVVLFYAFMQYAIPDIEVTTATWKDLLIFKGVPLLLVTIIGTLICLSLAVVFVTPLLLIRRVITLFYKLCLYELLVFDNQGSVVKIFPAESTVSHKELRSLGGVALDLKPNKQSYRLWYINGVYVERSHGDELPDSRSIVGKMNVRVDCAWGDTAKSVWLIHHSQRSERDINELIKRAAIDSLAELLASMHCSKKHNMETSFRQLFEKRVGAAGVTVTKVEITN